MDLWIIETPYSLFRDSGRGKPYTLLVRAIRRQNRAECKVKSKLEENPLQFIWPSLPKAVPEHSQSLLMQIQWPGPCGNTLAQMWWAYKVSESVTEQMKSYDRKPCRRQLCQKAEAISEIQALTWQALTFHEKILWALSNLPLQIIIHCVTYAGEPQRRVRDFCFSLSDLSELRQALNFPSRAALLGLATLKYRRAVKSKTKKTPSMLQQCQFFSNPFLEFCLSKPPKFFFHHLVPHVCPSI